MGKRLTENERLLRELERFPEEVMTEPEVAEFLRIKPETLRHRRKGYKAGGAPKHALLGGTNTPRYLKRWVLKYIEESSQPMRLPARKFAEDYTEQEVERAIEIVRSRALA